MIQKLVGAIAVSIVYLTAGMADAGLLFSESFDEVPSGTEVSTGTLPGWTVLRNSFQVSNTTSASAPNALLGSESGHRGAMFHAATGITDLQFAFLRRANTAGVNAGDSLEVGLTSGQQADAFDSLGAIGAHVEFFADARDLGLQPGPQFLIFNSSGSGADVWDLSNVLTDNTWYEGLIHLNSNGTVSFGYKTLSAASFTTSPTFALPSGFVVNDVGVTEFRAPAFTGADGLIALDDIRASSAVPEPGTWLLFLLGAAGFPAALRKARWRIAPSPAQE